jgi:hypothetical protein
MVRRGAVLAGLIAAALAYPPPSPALAAPPPLSLTAAPSRPQSGRAVTLSGQVTPAAAGSVVLMYEIPYPFRATKLVGQTVTSSTGAFSFKAFPDRDARYRAVLAGTNLAALVSVNVQGRTVTRVRALSLGRAAVSILVYHPNDLHWGNAKVRWSFATGRHGAFASAPTTRTVRLSRYVIQMRTTIALPAGHFSWRACFHAAGDLALLNPRRPPGCTGRGYHGGGYLPVGFPGTGAIAHAASYLARRIGRTAFAVVDTEGRMSGVNIHRTFPTASVVKAMLLVAYLRRLDARGQHRVDSHSNSFLYPMIHISDNNAATQTWSIVGDSGLYSVAAAAGMTDFSVSGSWGTALLSPADQAHFFFELDSLIPREFVGYARFLLSTIDPSQSWGIPVIARPLGYQTFFKDGSEPTALGQLVHQIDRLEGHRRTFAIAVMTDGDPTMQYGIDTIQGVAAALLH